ncbi:sensor histidine kinase [Mesorhizobium loti]|nr:HAMP domain-containing sensor histidine kinase [Mesorhizobium loti]PLP58431.1 sensor histidine kinase [Mesorhizobium loti]
MILRKPRRPRSLKWSLVLRIALLQGIMITLLIPLLIVGLMMFGVASMNDYEGGTADVIKDALARDANGKLVLKPTRELADLRRTEKNLWYVVRDKQGNVLREGAIPPALAPFADQLDNISEARFSWKMGKAPDRPAGIVMWEDDTGAGTVQILAGTEGKLSWVRLGLAAWEFFLVVILPVVGVMALATLFVTPWVVRGALRSLGAAANEAGQIDIDKRGVQLPLKGVPTEVTPLVNAVNEALVRLDTGYERHRRFLTDAAHELRTPVAILNTRVASLPPTPERARVLRDAARLSTLTDQLLDLQRLGRQVDHFTKIDLVEIARSVVLDMAPIAFSSGYEVAFEPAVETLSATGDRASIERAVTSLVQNAIEHGGNRGRITINVVKPATIEILDEGEGVPEEERKKIFQPFYRLRPHDHGAGLGLNLVQEIMQLHGGRIEVLDGRPGALFRISFPKPQKETAASRKGC